MMVPSWPGRGRGLGETQVLLCEPLTCLTHTPRSPQKMSRKGPENGKRRFQERGPLKGV